MEMTANIVLSKAKNPVQARRKAFDASGGPQSIEGEILHSAQDDQGAQADTQIPRHDTQIAQYAQRNIRKGRRRRLESLRYQGGPVP